MKTNVMIAEGYSTGCAVLELLKQGYFEGYSEDDTIVTVAFSASNLINIAKYYGNKDFKKILLTADRDAAGIKAANDCKNIGFSVVYPDLTDEEIAMGASDYNDYFQLMNKRGQFYEKMKQNL